MPELRPNEVEAGWRIDEDGQIRDENGRYRGGPFNAFYSDTPVVVPEREPYPPDDGRWHRNENAAHPCCYAFNLVRHVGDEMLRIELYGGPGQEDDEALAARLLACLNEEVDHA